MTSEPGFHQKYKHEIKTNKLSRRQTDGNTDLSQVVKVVLMMDPLVVGLQTVRLVGDIFDIRAEAVEKLAFK